MEISTLHRTLPLKTTAKTGLYKSFKSSPFCPSELGLTVLTNLQIRVQHTAWGMHITKTAEVLSSYQGSWKPHSTLTLIPRKHIHIEVICIQRLGLLWGKKLQVVISTVSILLQKKMQLSNPRQILTEKNCWWKDTRLHKKDAMCFC